MRGWHTSTISSEFAVEMWNVPSVLSVRPLARVAIDAPIPPLNPCNISVWKKAVFLCAYLPSSIMFFMSFIFCNCTDTFTRLPLISTDLLHISVTQSPTPTSPYRVQQSRPAFRFGAARAVLRRLPHRPAVSRKWCHNDWERKLRPDGRQNLRRRPFPDGEHQLLSARCLQDHVTKVKRHLR